MNTTTSSTKKKEKKKVSNINRDLERARKVALVQAPKRLAKVAKQAARTRDPVKPSLLAKWAHAVANPFEDSQAICPVNFNIAPTTMNTTARLTHIDLNVVVTANQTKQITIFPHGEGLATNQATAPGFVGSDLDAVAYHCGQVSNLMVAGALTVLSPFSTTNNTSTNTWTGALCLDNNVSLGGCTNGLVNGAVARGFDAQLPYSGAGSQVTHLRSEVVSIGARVYNTTPQLNRGGNVSTVQLVNQGGLINQAGASATAQRELEINPSFRTHGDVGEGMEIAWIPRTQDMAYWHPIVQPSGGAGDNFNARGYGGAGMVIFLNNNTANTQSYTLEIVWNVMIAGTSVQSISSESVVEPILRAPIEQVVTHMANNSTSAKTAPILARAASNSTAETSPFSERVNSGMYQKVVDTAHAVGEVAGALFRGAHRGSSYGHSTYNGILVPR